MSVDIINSFNGGELSETLNARQDIDKYKSGCLVLENMYVLPQGGVQRRTGSEYVGEVTGDYVKLLPFNFSEDSSYIIEFTSSILKIYDGNGDTGVELPHTYTDIELDTIKFKRIFDIMYLVCPTKPVQTLSRTSIDPLTFVLDTIEFDFPPLLDENSDINNTIGYQPIDWVPDEDYDTLSQVTYDGVFYQAIADITGGATFVPAEWNVIALQEVSTGNGNAIALYSNEGIFKEAHEGSIFNTSHQRGSDTVAGTGSFYPDGGTTTATYDEVFVSNEPFTIDTKVTQVRIGRIVRTGIVYIDKKETPTGTWNNVKTYSSPATYQDNETTITGLTANSYIRVRITGIYDAGGSFTISLPANRRIEFTSTSTALIYSSALDVSFSDWTLETSNTWNGSLELERSIDDGETWSNYITVGDTTGLATAAGETKNYTVSSSGKELATTKIRIKFKHDNGTIEANIINDTLYSSEFFIINEYVNENLVNVTVRNEPINNYSTNKWAFGAFNEVNGYPTAIELFEERLCYAGTFYDPATIWMSVVGDFSNFNQGDTLDDEAIKVIPTTAESTRWMLARDTIFLGTAGSILNIKAQDDSKTITPSNVKSSEQSAYGCEPVQAMFANDIAVYSQRLGKKLRDLVYVDEEASYMSTDLTILANHITDGGIKEMVFQKTPDQIIWILTDDGNIAGLTYERTEEVAGWHRHDFGGVVRSIAIRPSGGEDELWIAIERSGGIYIEKVGKRSFSDTLLDSWFVDSGVKTVLIDTQAIEDFEVVISPDFNITITTTDHGLVDGDKIRFSNIETFDALENNVFTVADKTDDTFKLKSEDGSGYINAVLFNIPETIELVVDYNGFPQNDPNGTYSYLQMTNDHPHYQYIYTKEGTGSATQWDIYFDTVEWVVEKYTNLPSPTFAYKNATSDGRVPKSGWELEDYTGEVPTIEYDGWWTDNLTGNFTQVSNVWDGLNHLEGENVQVQGDGSYDDTYIVEGGSITTDGYFNQTVIGLQYINLVQPMFIEPLGGSYIPLGENKNINSTVLKMYKTIGGVIGTVKDINGDSSVLADGSIFSNTISESDRQLLLKNYTVEKLVVRNVTNDLDTGIPLYTGDKLTHLTDSWNKLKGLYIMQNDAKPMTILGVVIKIKSGKEV